MKEILQFAALILGIVNGLALLRIHVRDRPRVKITPVHPETYQWWFRLPDGNREGTITRRWGFISYVRFANRGLRKTTIDSWNLRVRAKNWSEAELQALSLPGPSLKQGSWSKFYPVLGQKGEGFEGETSIDAGGGISGMTYHVYECYGDPVWDPRVSGDGTVTGEFTAVDVFDSKIKCKIAYHEKTIRRIKELVPSIEDVYE